MALSRVVLLLFVWCVLAAGPAFAQSTLNPDISVIPRFLLSTRDDNFLPDQRRWSRPDFSLEEFEIAIQANLNPYARADVFLAKPGAGEEPLEIEEAYVTFLKGLPFDMNVRAGKYLAEFGKLNMLHPHAWPFLTRPLSLERFFGDEGLNDLGISASILLPTGDELYSRLTIDVLRGNSVGIIEPGSGDVSGGIGLVDTSGDEQRYAASARAMVFTPLSENSDVEVGLSGMTAIHDPYGRYRAWYTNLDFKYKWRPDSYTALTISGEYMLNARTISDPDDPSPDPQSKSILSSGGYLYADYQFLKSYSIGARLDYSEAPYSSDDRAFAGAVFLGFYPVEETMAFRLQYQHTRFEVPGADAQDVNMVALQFLFSMGPHKAHPF